MQYRDFCLGMRVRVTKNCDLLEGCRGSRVLVQRGEEATVTDLSKFRDMVGLTFDRTLPFPEEFGGESDSVFTYAARVARGLNFDVLEPI